MMRGFGIFLMEFAWIRVEVGNGEYNCCSVNILIF